MLSLTLTERQASPRKTVLMSFLRKAAHSSAVPYMLRASLRSIPRTVLGLPPSLLSRIMSTSLHVDLL